MEIKEMKCEGREMDSSRSKQGPVSGSCWNSNATVRVGVGNGVYVCRLYNHHHTILDINRCTTLLKLVIQSVRASSEVTHSTLFNYYTGQTVELHWANCRNCHEPTVQSSVKVEVNWRLTVSMSVCLGVEHPYGTCEQILLPVWKLLSCICVAPSLTRGWACNLQCNHSVVWVSQNP
jgi:hypothetical protein